MRLSLLRRSFLLLAVFSCLATYAQQDITIDWQLVEPKYETADAFVAGLNVMDYGADPTGIDDQTQLFQKKEKFNIYKKN